MNAKIVILAIILGVNMQANDTTKQRMAEQELIKQGSLESFKGDSKL